MEKSVAQPLIGLCEHTPRARFIASPTGSLITQLRGVIKAFARAAFWRISVTFPVYSSLNSVAGVGNRRLLKFQRDDFPAPVLSLYLSPLCKSIDQRLKQKQPLLSHHTQFIA